MTRARRSRKARSIAKVVELAIVAPQVVALRTARMLAAGAHPGPADRAEFSRMGTEKVQAFWESMFAMGAQIVRTNQEYTRVAASQWVRLSTIPWQVAANRPISQVMDSLSRASALVSGAQGQRQPAMLKLVEAAVTPVHKRATANVHRLRRAKKQR